MVVLGQEIGKCFYSTQPPFQQKSRHRDSKGMKKEMKVTVVTLVFASFSDSSKLLIGFTQLSSELISMCLGNAS